MEYLPLAVESGSASRKARSKPFNRDIVIKQGCIMCYVHSQKCWNAKLERIAAFDSNLDVLPAFAPDQQQLRDHNADIKGEGAELVVRAETGCFEACGQSCQGQASSATDSGIHATRSGWRARATLQPRRARCKTQTTSSKATLGLSLCIQSHSCPAWLNGSTTRSWRVQPAHRERARSGWSMAIGECESL